MNEAPSARGLSDPKAKTCQRAARLRPPSGWKGPDTAESPPVTVRSAVVTPPFCLPQVSPRFSLSIFSISAFFA